MKTNENKIKQNKNKMDAVKMLSRQNNQKYEVSEKYSVGFYTLAGYAVFRYYEKRECGRWEIGRNSMLGLLSTSELKKLFKFEARKKEKYKKYQVYGIWEK